MPAAFWGSEGLNIRRQRAGRDALMLFSGEVLLLVVVVVGDPKAMVLERVSMVARTASGSFS